jgi:hypothetical protein
MHYIAITDEYEIKIYSFIHKSCMELYTSEVLNEDLMFAVNKYFVDNAANNYDSSDSADHKPVTLVKTIVHTKRDEKYSYSSGTKNVRVFMTDTHLYYLMPNGSNHWGETWTFDAVSIDLDCL